MEYEPPRDWWGVWENAAAVAFKNGRLRIEAPVRLSHAESWREGAVIHCKGYRLHPREPDAECTRAGGSTGMQQEKGRVGPLELCRTISGNDSGKKGNAPGTHGTRNGAHRDVGKVDMCVLNPAPRNPETLKSAGELVRKLRTIIRNLHHTLEISTNFALMDRESMGVDSSLLSTTLPATTLTAAWLAPGFLFHPTDEELVSYYLISTSMSFGTFQVI
ncbi:hypothetical protein YC2023_038308 [Brassica napus]